MLVSQFGWMQMLLQGGQSYVGFGRGESIKIALEAASLKSPFIQGWLAVSFLSTYAGDSEST